MADPTTLFSAAEAKAFDKKQLGTGYDDSVINAAEAEIREEFAHICGVSFIPKTETGYRVDGSGNRMLALPFRRLLSLTAVTIYDAAQTLVQTFDATDLSDVALYTDGRMVRRSRGTWLRGELNIALTFTHGYTTTPAEIKRAALILAVYKLVPTDITDRATYMSDGSMTFSLATPGMRGSYYGLPMVDAVLNRYSEQPAAVS